MPEEFRIKEFPNGLTLIAQPMAEVSSAAVTVTVPCGAAHDPPGRDGSGAVLSEWLMRGAGPRDTRALNDALDALGCQHHAAVLSEHIRLSASQLGRNLADVLDILADVLLRPRLEDGPFAAARDLIAQDLEALGDRPAQRARMLLREKFYPHPLGRCVYGTAETLAGLDAGSLRAHAKSVMTPCGAIVTAAGNIDWDDLSGQVERLLGQWAGDQAVVDASQTGPPGVTHIQRDSAQTHITAAFTAPIVSHESYYAARLAEAVLSGGMSGRLFTEVREKRGLVYQVSASYHSLKTCAGTFVYAGTVPEKAQETFDVTIGEIQRLAEGITDEEMARARTQLKASTIMQGESTGARAGALAGDWYHLRRLRTLEETSEAIDRTMVDDVLACLHEFPAKDFTILTIGPEPIDTTAAGVHG